MQIDDLKVKGTVNIVLKGPEGKVKKHKTIRNMVTAQGLAHIVGRMMDAGTESGPDINDNVLPSMMRFMAIGTGTTVNPSAPAVGVAPSTAYKNLNTLYNESTEGVAGTNEGFRIDMGKDRTDPGGGTPVYSELDKVYQGTYNSTSNQLLQDSGTTSEGTLFGSTDYQGADGTKKIGDRIVFVAVFREFNPGGSTEVVPVTEAGIFNGPGNVFSKVGGASDGQPLSETQTMLCRTKFDVVNKAPQDSLQITWSVALADATI
tara:strand:- start:2812 stop:3594 length:783 start_codon:yes stop_codon:yes gene_type:complete